MVCETTTNLSQCIININNDFNIKISILLFLLGMSVFYIYMKHKYDWDWRKYEEFYLKYYALTLQSMTYLYLCLFPLLILFINYNIEIGDFLLVVFGFYGLFALILFMISLLWIISFIKNSVLSRQGKLKNREKQKYG